MVVKLYIKQSSNRL